MAAIATFLAPCTLSFRILSAVTKTACAMTFPLFPVIHGEAYKVI
jgi:hypothetical protein